MDSYERQINDDKCVRKLFRTSDLKEGEFVLLGNLEFIWYLPGHGFAFQLFEGDDEKVEGLRMFEKQLVDVKTRRDASDVAQSHDQTLLVSFVEDIHICLSFDLCLESEACFGIC